MPAMTRRPQAEVPRPSLAERRRLRRGELLDAAIDVIRREGADVTMEEMASAGGISKPILYRHFVDRDGLVAAITETALVEIGAILDAKIAEALPDAPPHSIRATIDAFFEYVEREPELYRFIVDSDAEAGEPGDGGVHRADRRTGRGDVGAGPRRARARPRAGGDLGSGDRRHGAEHGGVVDRRCRHRAAARRSTPSPTSPGWAWSGHRLAAARD